MYYPPSEGEELVDPKRKLEPVCENKCKFWRDEYLVRRFVVFRYKLFQHAFFLSLKACVTRYQATPDKTGDCEPQYGGMYRCVDRCV